MRVLDPVVVAINKLPPWALALSATVVAAALLAQSTRSPKNKSHVKPRKIHSLGTKIPIFGDMLESLKHVRGRHDWIADMCQRFHHEPWQLRVPGTPTTITVCTTTAVEDVMVNKPDIFIKSESHRAILHDLMGDGIINSAGEHWFHQRKTAAKFFSARTLRLCMMQTMQRNIAQVHEVLDAKSDTGRLANLTELFHQFTLQTFLEVGVGIDAPIIGKSEPSAFKAIDEVSIHIMKRRLVPQWMWKLQRWLNTGNEKKIRELMAEVHAYLTRLVNQSLSKKKDEAAGDDKISTAVELFIQHSNEDTVGLRPRDLVDFVLNFMIGARDTSAVTTQWLFYRLSKHPEVEAKIRDEFAVKLPPLGVGPDGYITADHVKELVYLDAVIKETLRLNPAAPFLSRYATQDTVIDGDIFIKKGQIVGMPSYAMARNASIWGPDAAEFKPERWIDTKTGELLSFPAFKFTTFGAGPRTCLGIKLAMLNLRVLTANLLHRYKFELDSENDGTHMNGVVLAMNHELLAKVERI
jgi:cytochrome P450